MAFCTNCGANVKGAFCSQCGTPSRAAAGEPAATAAAPAPVRRKTSPIVWILAVVFGLFALGIIGVVGAGFFVVHKARQAGFDPELMRTNPGLAVGKLVAAVNPDVEVVKTNDAAGTITFRERSTGKEVTMTFDQAKSGKITFTADDDQGKTATVEIGGSNSKLPAWIPAYPGAAVQANITARGDSNDGRGEGGNFTFTTRDPVSKVLSFYQDKAREMAFKVRLSASGADGGTIIATDEEERRTLTVVVGSGSGETTVNLTYAAKR